MLKKRIIPCLDVKDGRVVNGVAGTIVGKAYYNGNISLEELKAFGG